MSEEVTKEELLEAISSGFTSIEKRFQEVEGELKKIATKDDLKQTEKRLGVKIDGISNRLDAEITRRTDRVHHARTAMSPKALTFFSLLQLPLQAR